MVARIFAAGVLGGLLWLFWSQLQQVPVAGSGSPSGAKNSSETLHKDAGTVAEVASHFRTAMNDGACLVVHDATTRTPLPGATITLIHGTDPPATLLDPPNTVADDEGRILLPPGGKVGTVGVVRARGHVPAVVEVETRGTNTVFLQRCGTLRVTALREDGRPVLDAWCELTVDAVGTIQARSGVPAPAGIGHPLARRPIWTSGSGDGGSMVFDELPPGQYFLDVYHPELIPATRAGVQGRVDVALGEQSVSVVMQDMYGVAFQCPHESPVVRVDWGAPTPALEISGPVVLRLPTVRSAFQSRFPDCQVYVHRPAHIGSDPPPVHCAVTCADGTRWRGSWPMAPVHSVRNPVFLELDTRPVREVTIVLRDELGHSYDGVECTLSQAGSDLRFHTATGEPVTVPYGTYGVSTKAMIRPLARKLLDLALVIDASSPATIELELGPPLTEVVVRVKGPDDPIRCPLLVNFDNGPNVANWFPATGPIRQLLQGKTVRVRVTSKLYEDAEVGPLPAKPGGSVDIEVPLVRRVQ